MILHLFLALLSNLAHEPHNGPLVPPFSQSPATASHTLTRVSIHPWDLPFTIDSYGYYILAQDVESAVGGITINASNVTLDLNGHRFFGNSGTAIVSVSGASNITIRNGHISFPSGIVLGGYPSCQRLVGTSCRVENVKIIATQGPGLILPNGGSASLCDITSHGAGAIGTGLLAGERCHIESSVVRGAYVSLSVGRDTAVSRTAIVAIGTYSLIGDDSVSLHDVTVEGQSMYGAALGPRAHVEESVFAASSTDVGLRVGVRSLVRSSRIIGAGSSANPPIGLVAGGNSLIQENTIRGLAVGVRLTEGGSRFEGNYLHGNAVALDVTGAGNAILGNIAWANGVDYSIAPGNVTGPLARIWETETAFGNVSESPPLPDAEPGVPRNEVQSPRYQRERR